MTVYAVTGIPYSSRERFVLAVYEQEKDAVLAQDEFLWSTYSDVNVEEVELHEHYIDNSLDYD